MTSVNPAVPLRIRLAPVNKSGECAAELPGNPPPLGPCGRIALNDAAIFALFLGRRAQHRLESPISQRIVDQSQNQQDRGQHPGKVEHDLAGGSRQRRPLEAAQAQDVGPARADSPGGGHDEHRRLGNRPAHALGPNSQSRPTGKRPEPGQVGCQKRRRP